MNENGVNLSGYVVFARQLNGDKRTVDDLNTLVKEFQKDVNEALRNTRRKVKKLHGEMDEEDSEQIFNQKFNSSFGSYELGWYIKTAKSICLNKTKTNLGVYKLLDSLSDNTKYNLELDYNSGLYSVTDKEKPIVVVPLHNVDIDGQLLVIDGNHRLYEAYRAKYTTIKAYLLSEEESINVMQFLVFQTVYAFAVSMTQIIKYLTCSQDGYRLIRKNNWTRSQKNRLCVCGSEKIYKDCCIDRAYYVEYRTV